MHETKETLKAFIANKLSTEDRDRVQEHIELCEFCSEYVENQRLINRFQKEVEDSSMPSRASQIRDQLYFDAVRYIVIKLRPLNSRSSSGPHQMAADGHKEKQPEIQGLSICSPAR